MEDAEIYFITNQSDNDINFEATFRVDGKQPELWDPVSGTIRDLPAFLCADKRTTIPLQLDSNGSIFIVFRKRVKDREESGKQNFPEPETLVQTTGPWEVTFDRSMGGPENVVVMPVPEDWTINSDARIKFYSGNAVYKTIFSLNEIPVDRQLFINLGKVNVMAEVKINGKFAGGVWTSPWRVNITEFVKQGGNAIEIEVVNNWINRLIGDSMLQEKERITWVNENPAKPGMPLQSSGLMGPVIIESVHF
jgi:hypothetical protein